MAPPGEYQGQDFRRWEWVKRALKPRERESNQRTISHFCLSEGIYLRKWGRFWWEEVCWYVCPPDLSVISHIKRSTTQQLAYRRRGLQEFGGFSEICSSSSELSEPTWGKRSSSIIFLMLWIFDIHAEVGCACITHPLLPLLLLLSLLFLQLRFSHH